MADQWAEFADAWDEFADADAAPAARVPAGGRRGRGRPDAAVAQQARREAYRPSIMGPTWGTEAENDAMADAGAILLAAPEIALSGIGGAAGTLADVATGDLNNRSQTWGNQVRTDVGQRGAALLGEQMAPAVEAASGGYDKLFGTGPLAQTLKERGAQAAEGIGGVLGIGAAANPVRAAVSAATRPAPPRGYTRAPVAEVAGRGYTVVPDDVRQSANIPKEGEITGYTRAGMGPAEVDTRIPMRNIRKLTAETTADLPATERGLLGPTGQVDAGLLEGAMNQATIPYQQVAQLPDPPVNTLADRLRQAWQERGGTLKGDAIAETRLLPLMAEDAAVMSSGDTLTLWKELNSYARGLRKQAAAGDAAAQIKSRDLQLIADSILDEIDDRAAAFANPQLTAELKQARVDLGRLHSLEDALDSTGWLDPTKLRAMKERGVPLSGGLAQAADLAGAAPRSFTPMGPAVNATRSRVDQFGREPPSYLRLQMGKLFGDRLARQGVESLNRELRAGEGLLRQPVPKTPVPPLYGPNAGPPAPPAPVRLLPPPEPRGPMQGGAQGGPAPALAGEFEDLGYTPDVREAGARHPGASNERAALTNSTVTAQPSTRRQLLGEETPAQTDEAIRTLIGELGGVSPRAQPYWSDALADFEMGNMERAMPDRPRGVTGPESASVKGKKPPKGFSLLEDDTPPPTGPRFGPDDEFPPAAPVLPQGPAPGGAGGGSVTLQRNVPEGVDPFTPRNRAQSLAMFEQGSPEALTEGVNYGPVQGVREFPRSDFQDVGTLEDLRQLVEGNPDMTVSDLLVLLRQRPERPQGVTFTRPPELFGTPREFHRFADE